MMAKKVWMAPILSVAIGAITSAVLIQAHDRWSDGNSVAHMVTGAGAALFLFGAGGFLSLTPSSIKMMRESNGSEKLVIKLTNLLATGLSMLTGLIIFSLSYSL